MAFSGTNHVPVLTMMAHAPVGHLDHSFNPTFIEYGQQSASMTPATGAYFYRESANYIKNTMTSSFEDPTASFQKTTYISKVGIYDENRNLIGIASVSKPVKKKPELGYTFKLKMDF